MLYASNNNLQIEKDINMKTWLKWTLIGGGALGGVTAIVAPILATQLNQKQAITSKTTQEPNNNNVSASANPSILTNGFDENISEYSKLATTSTETNYQSNESDLKPYQNPPTDPKDPVYNSLFAKLNETTVANDVYHFISNIKESSNNFNFKFKINNAQIKAINENNESTYKINISFEIYNSENKESDLSINNDPDNPIKIKFQGHEVINSELSISSIAIPDFLKEEVDENKFDLYANYYFQNVLWKFGDNAFALNKFYLNEKSFALNTSIKGVDTRKGYDDISAEGLSNLQKMTSQDFADDITNNFDKKWELTKACIGPTQKILQQVARNKPVTSLFKKIAPYVKQLTDLLVQHSNPKLTGLGSMLEKIFENKNICELLKDTSFMDGLENLLKINKPEMATTILPMIKQIATANIEQMQLLFGGFIKQFFSASLTPEQSELLGNITKQGLITFAGNYPQLMVAMMKQLIGENTTPILDVFFKIFESIKNFNPDKNSILDLLVSIIKTNDSKGNNLLKELLGTLLTKDSSPKIADLLEKCIYNNENLTVENLCKTISALSTPKDYLENIIDLGEYINTIKVTKSPISSKYDNSTMNLDLEYKVKYTLTKSLYYNVPDLLAIAPNKLKLNGMEFDAGALLNYALYFEFKIAKKDSIEITYKINDTVNYEVIKDKTGDDYQLSWAAGMQKRVDSELKNSYENMYSYGNNMSLKNYGVDNLLYFFNNFMYGYIDQSFTFKPLSSNKLNEVKIQNYNPNKLTNQAIGAIKLNDSDLQDIKDEIKDSVIITKHEDTAYSYYKPIIGSESIGYKYSTSLRLDKANFFKKLFQIKMNTKPNGKQDFRVYYNSLTIIRPGDSLLPPLTQVNITIETNLNVYSLDDGTMKNTWNFSL